MGPVAKVVGRRRVAGVATAIACLALAGTAAAGPSVRTVTSAEQRQRDQARQRILEDERRAEESARAEALARATERERAGDARGLDEARAALARHEANLAALRRELARAGGETAASDRGTSREARPPQVTSAPRPPVARSPAPPRPWDVYARASTPPTSDAAGWDLYARARPAPRDAAAVPTRPLGVYRELAAHAASRPLIPRQEALR